MKRKVNAINLKIITPKKIVLSEPVISVTVPTYKGEITVLPHHTSLFSLLVEGIIKIKKDEQSEDFLAIGGGYLETDGQDLHILVSKAYDQDEIDQKLIETAIDDAKKILSRSKNQEERVQANMTLRRSLIDMKLLKKRKRGASHI